MAWIMLRCKLATEVSPPKLSIHWAVPAPMNKYAEIAKTKAKATVNFHNNNRGYDDPVITEEDTYEWDEAKRCEGAMKIRFLGEDVIVFPDEYTLVSDANMAEYIDEREGSHFLIEDSVEVPGEYSLVDIRSKDERLLYEAALLDGCDQVQALRVMKGKDIDISTVPVLGWYRAHHRFARIFCRKGEDEITDSRKKQVSA